MASDYNTIRTENERRYGTDIGRIGPMLLANRYGDRTHFIFELLQNAEDALARRTGWKGSRSVTFKLTKDVLRVGHFGRPFDEADVRGICGIGESTKDLTDIGRFGIGFKSVYAFTNRPEIHSGAENFAIESFVWPVKVAHVRRDPNETAILIPLIRDDPTAYEEIATGLGRLGASALLFLRQIEEIEWVLSGGHSGVWLRESKPLDACVRRVTIIGQEKGRTDTDESWLVFSRPVTAEGTQRQVGYVEIAFAVGTHKESKRDRIQPVERSPLVVFFPTVLETYLGFFVQGPYRTTPSRDNVPRTDPWNQQLVRATASLLLESLRWLRDHELLDTTALECLPLDPTKFGEASMFAPLFESAKEGFISERLLPQFGRGYVTAPRGRLARTLDLRQVFSPAQLSTLFDKKQEISWLSGDITQDRTPNLRRYLMQELSITEITPEMIVPRLDKRFLEAQPDAWIVRLYAFLNDQPALRRRFDDLPLVRLEDGTHVAAHAKGQPQAFLPGEIKTAFPTVRGSVCKPGIARDFLKSLGLTEPDPVDDVIRNLLPKYQEDKVDVTGKQYAADIRRILTAFATDSKAQRDKLVAALRETSFVMVVDSGDASEWRSTPSNTYLATERLKELFAGVPGVFLVDGDYKCLHGEDVRELLEACGATRYLQPTAPAETLEWQELRQLRIAAGHEDYSWNDPIQDQTLRGLDHLLAMLPQLDPDARSVRAGLLWEALAELEVRRGTVVFSGLYGWSYYRHHYSASFDAAFVRQLNKTPWVPDSNGVLQCPEFVLFDTLGWKPNAFLQSKIRFKPPIIETLAREVGIEPGVLDLLKKLGVTSEAELRSRLGLNDEHILVESESREAVEEAVTPGPPPAPNSTVQEPSGSGSQDRGSDIDREGGGGAGGSNRSGADTNYRDDTAARRGIGAPAEKRSPAGVGGRPFISYVAVKNEEEPDPDGLDHAARMALESKAVDLILLQEPCWERTPARNPGYDLFEPDGNGAAIRWCEVKAMTGCLEDRPVGLSRTQFEHAQKHGQAYWLYVVEHAGTDTPRILRIQDPAGKARTFTFDRGWIEVADTSGNPVD